MAKTSPRASSNDFHEIGVAGVHSVGGRILEEYHPELRGEKGRRAYQDMEDNCSLVGAFLFIVGLLIQRTPWTARPVDEHSPQAVEMAVFLDSILDDMSHAWVDALMTAFSMVVYGWSWLEVVLKRRLGPEQKRPEFRSRFEDGLIGIRKMAFRPQSTLDTWDLDDHGGVQGMWQRTRNGVGRIHIPIERSLLFRAGRKYSPEGRSVLRPAYRDWHGLKNIDDIEGIGIERELNGLAMASIPSKYLAADASVEEKAIGEEYLRMVRDIKLNEQGGLVIPSDPWEDENGNPTSLRKVMVELLSTKGTRAIDTDKAARRREQAIARTLVAEFLLLGMGPVGSFAMHEDKTELFLLATQGWMMNMADVLNRHLVPRLWRLNPFPRELQPVLEPGKVKPEDLGALSEVIERLTRAGMELFPDDNMDTYIRSEAGWPARTVEGRHG